MTVAAFCLAKDRLVIILYIHQANWPGSFWEALVSASNLSAVVLGFQVGIPVWRLVLWRTLTQGLNICVTSASSLSHLPLDEDPTDVNSWRTQGFFFSRKHDFWDNIQMLAVGSLFPSTYKLWKTVSAPQWRKGEECENSWVFSTWWVLKYISNYNLGTLEGSQTGIAAEDSMQSNTSGPYRAEDIGPVTYTSHWCEPKLRGQKKWQMNKSGRQNSPQMLGFWLQQSWPLWASSLTRKEIEGDIFS